jgi:hypothetical protein
MSLRGRRSGQVVVEMLLVLPVFLTIIFSIMEIGYVSFRVIVLNHATYEVARIGGMTCASAAPMACPQPNDIKLSTSMSQILPGATISCVAVPTLIDQQAQQQNCDLQCTAQQQIKLVFPISSFMLADQGTPGLKILTAKMGMPIERPLQQ